MSPARWGCTVNRGCSWRGRSSESAALRGRRDPNGSVILSECVLRASIPLPLSQVQSGPGAQIGSPSFRFARTRDWTAVQGEGEAALCPSESNWRSPRPLHRCCSRSRRPLWLQPNGVSGAGSEAQLMGRTARAELARGRSRCERCEDCEAAGRRGGDSQEVQRRERAQACGLQILRQQKMRPYAGSRTH